jgi:hypothetical protein
MFIQHLKEVISMTARKNGNGVYSPSLAISSKTERVGRTMPPIKLPRAKTQRVRPDAKVLPEWEQELLNS